jgi:hypothetical protein
MPSSIRESVPVEEKVVSIFEPHTDIIRKDRGDTYVGHRTLTARAPLRRWRSRLPSVIIIQS